MVTNMKNKILAMFLAALVAVTMMPLLALNVFAYEADVDFPIRSKA